MMKIIKTAILILLTLTTAWSAGFAAFYLGTRKAYPLPPENTDAIIVLTGGKNRIKAGLALLSIEFSSQLFITGVHPDTKLKDIKATWPDKNFPCCVTLGHQATTTIQNAQEVQKWLTAHPHKTLLLVTSDYHMTLSLIHI